MYIDTHLHLSEEDYEDIKKVVDDAYKNNVKILIVSCCTYNEILSGLNLVKEFENIFLAIGLHPSESENYTDSQLKRIKDIAMDKNNRIIAIGEIGLDYHYGKEDKEEQKELFIKQLEIAKSLNLPVVIHTRDAVEDTLSILKKHKVVGVVHCFSGSLEIAKVYLSLGFKLGIGGVVTFKNSKLPNIINDIGIDNIVLETDSPYLAPEPFRGKKNEPKNVPYIAKKIAESIGKPLEFVEEKTTKNALTIFDLKM